jgi:hypothetical protein
MGNQMNFQTTVMAATVGMLTCPDECLSDALVQCDRLFDSSVLYSTDKPSVAVRSVTGVTPLRDWVMGARASGLLACRTGFGVQRNGDSAPHRMAGFLGGRPCSLHVSHAGGCDSYHAGTISSPSHAMTVAQFADLINAQANPEFFWHAILADINQFHSCNGIAAVAPEELADFLLSDAGASAWNSTGDQLMQELQVEALTFGEPFRIPASLADLLEKVVPIHDMFPYVSLDAYDDDEVTGSHLSQLINAQPFHADIWRQCADPGQLAATLGENFDLTEFPRIDAMEWGHYLQGLDANDSALVRDELLALIRLECERRCCEPLIPAALEDIFGPDDEERRRLSFRGRLQHDMGWYLASHPTPWCMYVLDEDCCEAGVANETAAAIIKVDHQQRFEAALEAIAAFAVKVQSPFLIDFQLAQDLAAEAQADAPFDRVAFERICTSKNVPDYLAGTELIDLFAAFDWRTRRVLGLAAVAAADVFGAMGSWNDQSFDGDEAAQFETVSSELFFAMNSYLAALLTVELR